jgi:hypothetical protein
VSAEGEAAVVDSRYSQAQLSFLLGPNGFSAAIAPGKFLDAARGVDKLLFAGEEGMTSGANADLNALARGAGVIHRAASADHICLVIFWMNACFHLLKEAPNVSTEGNFCKR